MPDQTDETGQRDILPWGSLPRRTVHKTSKPTDSTARSLRGWAMSVLARQVSMDTVILAALELAVEKAGRDTILRRAVQIETRSYPRPKWDPKIEDV